MHEYTLQELMSLYHSRRVKNKANMPNERQEQQQKKNQHTVHKSIQKQEHTISRQTMTFKANVIHVVSRNNNLCVCF